MEEEELWGDSAEPRAGFSSTLRGTERSNRPLFGGGREAEQNIPQNTELFM